MTIDFKTEHGVAEKLLALAVMSMIALAGVLPVIVSVVESAGVDGSTATVLGLLPLFLSLIVLLAFAEPVLERVQ
jgi:hypothetical protein